MKERQTMGKRERKETDKKKKNKERKKVRQREKEFFSSPFPQCHFHLTEIK